MKKSLSLILAFSLFSGNLISQNNKNFIRSLKNYLGVAYEWGGRSTKAVDCMGLIFLAYSEVTNKNWRKLSVDPVELIKNNQLGKPVEGLDGILREELDDKKLRQLKPGDIIYFLTTNKVIPKPIKIKGKNYYIWHMAVYIGKENGRDTLIIHADPFDRKVELDNLFKIPFDGIYVTRPYFE